MYDVHLPAVFPWTIIVSQGDAKKIAAFLIERGSGFAVTSQDVTVGQAHIYLSKFSYDLLSFGDFLKDSIQFRSSAGE